MSRMLFHPTGVHIMAGGQYGSEGKGALAAWLAEQSIQQLIPWNGVITSAGPNSGHTSYFGNEKIVLKQLPTFAVQLYLRKVLVPVYFSAGAVIDPEILIAEHKRYPEIPIFIHPCAAVVAPKDKAAENDPTGSIYKTASTRSGTGAAIARKVYRDPHAVYGNNYKRMFDTYEFIPDPSEHPYFMEISQGYSLGLNDPLFYPNVTSRECTFAQGMADARIAMTHYKRGYLCFRTFPIRVGNVDEYSSGKWYPGQDELTWEEIGVPAELTTVTKRVRRVAQFSWQQFRDSVRANEPTHVFINFMNYLDRKRLSRFIVEHSEEQRHHGYQIIWSYGPKVGDVGYGDSARTTYIRARNSSFLGSDDIQAQDKLEQG